MGLLEPVSCKNIICIITKIIRVKGKIKCRLKNRTKVALSTEKPPQIHKVIVEPQ